MGKNQEAKNCNEKLKEIKLNQSNIETSQMSQKIKQNRKISSSRIFLLIVALIVIVSVAGFLVGILGHRDTLNSNHAFILPTEISITTTPLPRSQILNPTTTSTTSVSISTNKYREGDEIQRSINDPTYDKNRAWVILKVNYDEEKYTIGSLYYDLSAEKWFKLNDDLPEVRFFGAIERDYPNLIGYINWNNIPIKYSIKTCDGNTILSYSPEQPNCGSSKSEVYPTSSYSGGGSGVCPVGQCYVNSYYRKDGTYVHGYCRKC